MSPSSVPFAWAWASEATPAAWSVSGLPEPVASAA